MGRFTKKFQSVKSNKDFQFLFRKGQSLVNYAFVCYYRPSKRRINRCGIVTSKKIGNAVNRNRSRRVLREAFRMIEPLLRERTDNRFDIILVARGKTPSLKSTQIYGLMKKQLLEKLCPQNADKPE